MIDEKRMLKIHFQLISSLKNLLECFVHQPSIFLDIFKLCYRVSVCLFIYPLCLWSGKNFKNNVGLIKIYESVLSYAKLYSCTKAHCTVID